MKYATFYVDENTFGIPVQLVQEVSRVSRIYPIPGNDSRLAGLINLRGKTTVVVNMRQALIGSECQSPVPVRQKLIILEDAKSLSAEARANTIDAFEEQIVFLVDQLGKIIESEHLDYYQAPAHVKEEFVEGVLKYEGNLITLISIKQLVSGLIHEHAGV